MLSLLRRDKRSNKRAGLYLTSDGVAAAALAGDPGGAYRLTECVYQPLGDDQDADALVGKLAIAESGALFAVLAPQGYQLLLVEAPDVPEEELRAAVRWRIKDLIDFHVDDAVIDVFEMPAHSRGGQARMMYAVAARAEQVKRQVEMAATLGIELQAIDIPELCLRNVADLLEQEGRGAALLHLADDHGVLIVVRAGVMYLTRHIETGVDTLGAADGLRGELVAGLALEVRRSLDYFESHYDQKPVSSLFTTGLGEGDKNDLAVDLSLEVKGFSLSEMLNAECELSEDLERRCLPAVGAALRSDPVTL